MRSMTAMKFIAQSLLTLCLLLAIDPSRLLAQGQPPTATTALPKSGPAPAGGESGLMLLQVAAEHGDPVAQLRLGDASTMLAEPAPDDAEKTGT